MSERSPIHEKVEKDLPEVFGFIELQPMHVAQGMVWRKARAVVGEDRTAGEEWFGMQETMATLSPRNSRYEYHNVVAIRRLSRPAMAAVLDMDKKLIHVWQEEVSDVDLAQVMPEFNRGWAILKLFGQPKEISRHDTPWTVDEDL